MRSLRSRLRRDRQRGGLVIARETYRRLTDCPSRRCNGIVTTNGQPPDARNGAPGGCLCRRKRSYSAAFQTGRPPAMMLLRRASIQGRNSFGSGAYPSSGALAWPSVSAHHANCTSARAFAVSLYDLCSSSHVKVEMGYACGPAELVIETRKSVLGPMSFIAPAAAAVTDASDGAIQLPELLRRVANGILLISAYASSVYPMAPGV